MRAMKFQNWPQHPAQSRGDHPLAQSAFNGENRLRELEHLAETARKVRDQAAADLTRNGNTHHIARDRLAAAERMLQKTKKEMQELRAQLGLDKPKPKPKPTPQSAEDFELAMLLGNSNKRLKRDELGPDTFTIEADEGPRSSQYQGSQSYTHEGPASRQQTQRSPSRRGSRQHPAQRSGRRYERPSSLLRILGVSLFVLLGVGLGAAGTYLMVTSESVPDAAQKVSDGAVKVTTQIKSMLPQDTAAATATNTVKEPERTEPAPSTTAVTPAETSSTPTVTKPKPVKLDPFQKRALEEQEERLRKAAAERLAKAIEEQKAAAAAAENEVMPFTEETGYTTPATAPAGYPPPVEDAAPGIAPAAELTAPVVVEGALTESVQPAAAAQVAPPAPVQQSEPTLLELPLTHPEAFE